MPSGWVAFSSMLAFWIAHLLPFSSIQIIRASCTVKMGLYLRIFFLSFSFRVFFFLSLVWWTFFFLVQQILHLPFPPRSLHLTSSLHTPHKFVHFNRFAVFFLYLWVFFQVGSIIQKVFISWRPSIQSISGFGSKSVRVPPPTAASPFVSFRTSSHRSRNLARSLYPYIDVSITPSPPSTTSSLLLLAYPRSTLSIILPEALFLLSVGVV